VFSVNQLITIFLLGILRIPYYSYHFFPLECKAEKGSSDMHFQLLGRFLTSPRSIGSIVPSSKFLVHALVDPIPWDKIKTVVELGGGTGVVTGEIAKRLAPDAKAIIFENDPVLSEQLKGKFPHFYHAEDAQQMRYTLQKNNISKVDAIISCLPFANFPSFLTTRILKEASHSLAPDGLFVQFQYSLQMRKRLLSHFRQVNVRFVPINIPPSFVYICRPHINPVV
jgi:phospholipid N-methyltransferase